MDRRAAAKKSNKWRKKKNVDNNTQQVKEPGYFSDDTILEAAKFLNYRRWAQMRFLCHRVNQLIHNNQSKLQAFEVKSFSLEEISCRSNLIVSFDQKIQSPNAIRKWFQDRGYSCDETTDMPLEKVFVGVKLSGKNGLHFTIRALYEESTTLRFHDSRPPQVFSAKFNAQFYGPILSHFFRLLHHPAAYFREVTMLPPLTDKFCDMTSHSPIRCDQFTLLVDHSYLSYSSLKHSLEWLKDNVRAQIITLSFNKNDTKHKNNLCSLVSEFLIQNASICARDRIKLEYVPRADIFINVLIKNYETLEATKAIPSIVLELRLYKLRWNQSPLEFFKSNYDPMDYPPLYDKCDSCDIKTYGRQMDGNRKLIAQFGRCFGGSCLYSGSVCCMKFE